MIYFNIFVSLKCPIIYNIINKIIYKIAILFFLLKRCSGYRLFNKFTQVAQNLNIFLIFLIEILKMSSLKVDQRLVVQHASLNNHTSFKLITLTLNAFSHKFDLGK